MTRPVRGRLMVEPGILPLCVLPRRDLAACQHFFPTDLAFLPSGDFPHANRSHDRQIGFEAPFHPPFDFLYCAPFENMFEPAIAACEQPWLWRKQRLGSKSILERVW